jgi:hypothetical protein
VPFGAAKIEEAQVFFFLSERVCVDAECQLGVTRQPSLDRMADDLREGSGLRRVLPAALARLRGVPLIR